MSLVVVLVGGAAAGWLFGTLASRSRSAAPEGDREREAPGRGGAAVPSPLLPDVVLPQSVGVPFAEGLERPVWPLRTRHPRRGVVSYRGVDGRVRGNWSRRFGAPRQGKTGRRKHAGIDLFAYAGDTVLAMASGTVTAVQSFHLGSWAVFIDHGPVTVMYGEVDKGSWTRLGLEVGSTVRAGQPVAEVACMVRDGDGECRSHMLHLEAYAPGTTTNHRWPADQDAPAALRDPSRLLLLAAGEASTPTVA